jgi:hypothetical protein
MHMAIDSELVCRVQEEGADPLAFIPLVNFATLADPCITEAF